MEKMEMQVEIDEEEKMTARQTVLLIEWLREQGFTSDQIVACLEYINK